MTTKTCKTCSHYRRRWCDVEECTMERTNQACEDYAPKTCNDCIMCTYHCTKYSCGMFNRKVSPKDYCEHFKRAKYKACLDGRLSVPRARA